ncbi:putative speedy protein E7 [Equus przewalskii]|uniref:Speedy protein E7 n=1 Tax=Equus przewalskii TaxID=9798 RepID=A0ABM2EMW2_EQUPR|nr:PREDICTED: putative speedy protein E7 [Equus przewalskii]XP_008518480.1 PREDICTED: putative speedy protein E7 [Equus przewalskii]
MEGKTEVSSRQKDPWKEAQESSFCLAKKAPRKRSPLASSSASLEAVPEQRTRRRGQKRKRPTDVKEAAQQSSSPASNSTPSEAVSELKSWKKRGEKRNIWTVNHVEGTKLRMNKRRRPSYRPEDQEAFYRLLEDPVIQSFLEADIFLKVSDKYLLSMVVEYFGRVGLPGHLYNRIHFFLALYIASDMEEDNPMSKRSIFQFLLGREHWPDLYKEFLKLKVEFFYAMGFRAWVTPELCEEIQAQNPHHWVWSRVRQCAP